MLEKDLERKCGQIVKRLGGLWWKFTSPGNTGVPDRVMILPNGKIIFVELKGPHGKVSPKQAVQIDKLRDCGVTVWVIWDYEIFMKEMQRATS